MTFRLLRGKRFLHFLLTLDVYLSVSVPRVRIASQARIRHLLMTPKQVRDERLRKYRVGFMGMRTPRSFEDDD